MQYYVDSTSMKCDNKNTESEITGFRFNHGYLFDADCIYVPARHHVDKIENEKPKFKGFDVDKTLKRMLFGRL